MLHINFVTKKTLNIQIKKGPEEKEILRAQSVEGTLDKDKDKETSEETYFSFSVHEYNLCM